MNSRKTFSFTNIYGLYAAILNYRLSGSWNIMNGKDIKDVKYSNTVWNNKISTHIIIMGQDLCEENKMKTLNKYCLNN
jgi:hypothetical protein